MAIAKTTGIPQTINVVFQPRCSPLANGMLTPDANEAIILMEVG